jgi:predicted DsbA family dithiol-disulfide isomerase
MSKPVSASAISIEHYSDVLCIWAYIAQARIAELQIEFAEEVRIDYRFLQVFGDVAGKMATQWSDRNGIAGYAAHVQEIAAQYPHVEITPDAWLANTPTSSLPAHLALCGLRIVAPERVQDLLIALRHAFFVDLVDISDRAQLLTVVTQLEIDAAELERALDSGAAHALLSADLAGAAQSSVRSSPTLIFNEGRQMLSGNVGYRVIEANVSELLRNPGDQQTWC